METKLNEYEYKGKLVQIHLDRNPENPRSFENLGTMVCFHKRYDLSDTDRFSSDDFDDWDDLWNYLRDKEDAIVLKPLYLLDHSGLRISTSPFRSSWDSGRVGIIYCTEDDIKDFLNVDEVGDEEISNAGSVLESEVNMYDAVLSGQVYGFRIVNKCTCSECGHEHEIEEDSCYGYYVKEDAREDAEEYIDNVM